MEHPGACSFLWVLDLHMDRAVAKWAGRMLAEKMDVEDKVLRQA